MATVHEQVIRPKQGVSSNWPRTNSMDSRRTGAGSVEALSVKVEVMWWCVSSAEVTAGGAGILRRLRGKCGQRANYY
ncbi:hypothetical protein J1614_012119 [Plenodomus biglobosus]|nr:hypothetical protein J1614_012119 [Plenodomus biglobosus]